MSWSAEDMPDQTGRTAVVTGATSGLGLETAFALARRGARVVLTARHAGRGEAAAGKLREAAPGAEVEVAPLDLTRLSSVRDFAAAFADRHDRLDLLVNNAGVMATPRERTADGFELQIGTNHLGHFALTGRLLPTLLATPGARVVTVSSNGHRPGRIDFADLNWEHRRYSRWPAYFQSKLANLLFALELDRRLLGTGADLRSTAAHPGAARSNLGHGYGGPLGWLQSAAIRAAGPFLLQSAAQGALPQLRAATDPDLAGGSYLGPDGPGERTGAPVLVGTSERARDAAAAERLWTLSAELTGVEPGLPAG